MRVAGRVVTGVAVAAVGVISFGTAGFATPGNTGKPSQNTFTVNCQGIGPVTGTAPLGHNARPAFSNGGVFEALSVTFTQDSTGTVLASKTYGNTNGGGTPTTCTAPGGPGVTVTVVVVPIGPAAR